MKAKPEPAKKKISLSLRCNLTDQEKIAAGKELAETTNRLTELENDKSRVVSDFKAKITAEEAQVAMISNKVRSGYEFRDVECVVTYDTPKPGQKEIVRLDTKEVVRVEQMSEAEKQRDLPLEDDEGASESAAPESSESAAPESSSTAEPAGSETASWRVPLVQSAPEGCDHLRVTINAIVRPFDPAKGFRVIGGNCQDCTRDVRRRVTRREIETGQREGDWR